MNEMIGSKIIDSEILNSEIIGSEIKNLEIISSELINSELISSDIKDSRIKDSGRINSEIIHTERINTELIDFEAMKLNIRKGDYPYLGSGSGRNVYDLGNGYVVKVSKNSKGIAQNKVEHQISLTDDSNIFAKVIAKSENNRLLIMEKADRIKDFSEVRAYFNVTSNKELFRLDEIKSVYIKHNVLLNDLYRTANWGMIHGRPVIIDYGFTERVRRRYYSPFNIL